VAGGLWLLFDRQHYEVPGSPLPPLAVIGEIALVYAVAVYLASPRPGSRRGARLAAAVLAGVAAWVALAVLTWRHQLGLASGSALIALLTGSACAIGVHVAERFSTATRSWDTRP
jgi:hypothetical protein